MLRHAERGQAVFETAIFAPILLLGLFGVFLAVTQGAMTERTQIAVRYAGMIGGVSNPYNSTSAYAMMSTLDGIDPNPTTCSLAAANTALLTSGRHTFWQPSAGSITTSCWQQRETMFAGSSNSSYYNGYNFMFHSTFVSVAASVPISNFLTKGALNGATSARAFASTDFTSTGTVADMLECTYVGPVAKASMEAGTYQPPLDYLSLNNGPNPGATGNPPGNGGGGWPGSSASPLPAYLPVVINMPFPLTCNQYSQTTNPQPTASPYFGPPVTHTPAAS